jgi:excisionase family DNA binding protein
MMARKYLTAAEVAEILSVSLSTVKRWAEQGTIPAVRMGPRILRFPCDEFDEWELKFRTDGRIRAPRHADVLPLPGR